MTTLSTDWKLLNDKTVSYGPWSGKFKLYAKIVSTDIANNRTKVAYDWDFETTAGYSASSYDAQDYVTAAGWNDATYRTYSGSGNLRHGEEWITHNADGTKSESCSGRTRMGGIGVDTGWVSADFDLPRIPRASSPTLSPNPQTWSNTSSNTLTVTTNRKASSFTHSVKCDVWSYKVTNTGVGTSTTFAIPYSTLASMPDNLLSFTGSVYTQTYSGSTAIGSEVRTPWTIKVDTSIEHPNIGTITVEDINTRTSAIVGAETFIYGISTLQATIPLTVSGDYTQLASAVVTCGNRSQTYTLSGTSQTITFTFDKVDAPSLTVKVTDKRGTSVSKTKSYTLMPYQPETLTATVGRVTATGSTAVGQVSGIAYGGNYGQASNELTVTYKYKEHDSSTWIDSAYTATLTLNSGQQTYTHAITLLEEYDYQKQYDIQFIVNDLFNTATYTAQLMQGLPILSWDETEVDVWGSLHIHDRDNPTNWQDVMEGFDAVFANDGHKNLVSMVTPTKTENGVTFTHSGTYYNINGTATDNAFCNATTDVPMETGKTYILSGMHDEWQEGIEICVRYVDNVNIIATATKDDVAFTCPAPCYAYVVVKTGTTVSNKKWYPMIRDARIASEAYVPNHWAIHNWNYSGSWSGNSSVTRDYKILGKGLVFATATASASTTSDTGTVDAYVELRTSSSYVRTLGANRNRLTSANSAAIQASATGVYYYDGASGNDRLRLYASCTKNGTNQWHFEITTIGCAITQV